MRNLLSKVLVVCAVLLPVSLVLQAQQTASITGTVTDQTGAVIPGVNVTLENPSTSVSYKGVTNAEGSYTISSVQPGPGYKITFEGAGFKSVVLTGLYLNVNSTRMENAKLTVGAASQQVEVSASTQTVTLNTTDATVGNNFQVQFLNDLPIANRDSPAALFTQQPGVTLDGSVTGARVDQDNVTVDGLDVNDNTTGDAFSIVGNAPVDSVQEFRGVTAGVLSSAGEGGGGQFDLVTRGGTNKFHGALVEYHRDTDLQANDWFNNNAGVGRPPLIRNQFGGNIGGPIKRDRLFFFFDYNGRRDTRSNLVERTVPMDAMRNGGLSYYNADGGVSTLSGADMAALDPLGIGAAPALLTAIQARYPEPNDFTVGDGVNTAGFRFNAPYPVTENDYVGRVDYNLTSTQKLSGIVTFARENATESAIQFPGDPQTFPFLDKSYRYAAIHTWTIGSNKVNQAEFGETYQDWAFPNTYNPNGINQFYFGGLPSGGTFLSTPYAIATNAQARQYPVPVVKDDFTWVKGKHSWTMGGTFKWVSPHNQTILDYNEPTVGLGGQLPGLDPSLRPADIATDDGSLALYDQAFTFALGRYQSIGATYNYDAHGNVLAQGTGSKADYRFYETEVYFGDTWKVTPTLTLSYGLRWQNYSVPYETHGIESVPDTDFDTLWNARVAQSKSGAYGPTTDCNPTLGSGVPCVSYVLGGKANNGPGYFEPVWKNFAPRFAFAWMPSADARSVISGGGGIVYDHTVVSSVQYQAAQYSYLFQSSSNRPFGVSGDAVASLATDPRFGGFDSPPAPAPAPTAISSPYTPFVDEGVPFGLANGQAFNEGVDYHLKTPYSIAYNFGFQHEFPAGFILKTTYVGRLGRRLLGQADANQLIDFPDSAGNSGQSMGQAFAAMVQNVRAGTPIAAQPWFENMVLPGIGQAIGFNNNTDFIANYLSPLPYRGDFADTIELLAAFGLLPDNVGMGSQFSEFTYYTNKGFSSYNGLLATLHKNAGSGLQFDINYTWAHSIDNVSVVANAPAIGGYGFICDVQRPRSCRGNSDFDVSSYLNGNFIWELPVGRGKAIAGTAPAWANQIVGGWSVSGLPAWHTGPAYFAKSSAFVAGYANDAPALLTGSIASMKSKPHKDIDGTLWAFGNEESTVNNFVGPVGFQIGTRNNLRGPGYFALDLGLGKTFPLWTERVNLKFRADAFNVLNHPNFDVLSDSHNDITESQGRFGVLTSTVAGSSGQNARVLQLALRLEF
jgi:Carboxypeptidase regulatory-like domain